MFCCSCTCSAVVQCDQSAVYTCMHNVNSDCYRIANLDNLEEIYIGNAIYYNDGMLRDNTFTAIPEPLLKLPNLCLLNMDHLATLKTLHKNFHQLQNLENISIEGCDCLQEPPSHVCQQGVKAIELYYRELQHSSVIQRPVISAAVIGNRMAGKTSLIRSLKHERRSLTHSSFNTQEDETTRVFQVNEVTAGNTNLRVFDLGGDAVYHISYQLTIRPNYIPIVVVSMEQFDHLASGSNVLEATRQLCMDYLSHLYLACPKLGKPILVLTHQDKLVDSIFQQRKDQLLGAISTIRKQIIEEESAVLREGQILSYIDHLYDQKSSVFASKDLFIFGCDMSRVDNIFSLLDTLSCRCEENSAFVPSIWLQIVTFFEESTGCPFIPVSEVFAKFPTESTPVVLRSMHTEGRIFWFEKDPTLKELIFHRISAITEVIEVLFEHRSEALWEQRQKVFKPCRVEGKLITCVIYKKLVKDFLSSGVLDQAILTSLLNSHSIPMDKALAILHAFYMICGPIVPQTRPKFIIPYLAQNSIEVPSLPAIDQLRVQLDVKFVGFSPPSYVYHLLVVAFLNKFTDPRYKIKAAGNGAVVYRATTKIAVIHNSRSRQICIVSDMPVGDLTTSWKTAVSIMDTILAQLKSIWVASHPMCTFICTHCLYIGETQPDCEVDPEWYTPPSNTSIHQEDTSSSSMRFTGVDLVDCCNDKGMSIPSPLKYPSK